MELYAFYSHNPCFAASYISFLTQFLPCCIYNLGFKTFPVPGLLLKWSDIRICALSSHCIWKKVNMV